MGVFESEHDMCISIHALLAESDQTNGSTTIPNFNFYPRSPCGERPHDNLIRLQQAVFLSTLSLRRATVNDRDNVRCHSQFLSTLSLRRATDIMRGADSKDRISIHALLAESDPYLQWCHHSILISIHALLAESDCILQGKSGKTIFISIHALLAESDFVFSPCRAAKSLFLSTLSLRRATKSASCRCVPFSISIHALLAESDLLYQVTMCRLALFLSTLSLRRATPRGFQRCLRKFYFYPRSPCGERLLLCAAGWAALKISIHALLAESDFGTIALTYRMG